MLFIELLIFDIWLWTGAAESLRERASEPDPLYIPPSMHFHFQPRSRSCSRANHPCTQFTNIWAIQFSWARFEDGPAHWLTSNRLNRFNWCDVQNCAKRITIETMLAVVHFHSFHFYSAAITFERAHRMRSLWCSLNPYSSLPLLLSLHLGRPLSLSLAFTTWCRCFCIAAIASQGVEVLYI